MSEKLNDGTSVAAGPDGVNVARNPTEPIVRARVAGDGYDRTQLLANGTLLVGNGVSAPTASVVSASASVLVDSYGADPTGVADSSQAFRDAIATTQVVMCKPGATYKFLTTVNLALNRTIIAGNGATIIATAMTAAEPCFLVTGIGVTIENLGGAGKATTASADSATSGDQFIRSLAGYDLRLRDIYTTGFSNAIVLNGVNRADLENINTQTARNHGLVILGPAQAISGRNLLIQTTGFDGSGPATEHGNVYILSDGVSAPIGVALQCAIWDEPGGGPTTEPSCIYVKAGTDIRLTGEKMYYGPLGYGVRIGAAAKRVTVSIRSLVPFTPASVVPANTVAIEAGAEDVILQNIITDRNGGGDISDAGTRTVWSNVSSSAGNNAYRAAGNSFTTTPLPVFKPADIPGCLLDLDFAAVAAGAIASHADLSGLGNTATQGVAANQPTGVVNVQNGKNIARFDGVNDHLISNAVNLGTSWTVIAIAKKTSQPGAFCDLTANRSSTDDDPLQNAGWWANGGDNRLTIGLRNDPGTLLMLSEQQADPGLGTFRMYTWTRQTTSLRIDRDNAAVVSTNTTMPTPITTNTFTIGASVSLAGASNFSSVDIGRLLVYSRRLSTPDMARLYAYLDGIWAVP